MAEPELWTCRNGHSLLRTDVELDRNGQLRCPVCVGDPAWKAGLYATGYVGVGVVVGALGLRSHGLARWALLAVAIVSFGAGVWTAVLVGGIALLVRAARRR